MGNNTNSGDTNLNGPKNDSVPNETIKYHKGKNKRLWIRIVFICFFISGTLFLFSKGCINTQTAKVKPEKKISYDKYNVLVTNWNKYVNQTDFESEYYLKSSAPEATIKQLNILFRPFFSEISPEVRGELIILKKSDKYSLFRFYHEFLLKYSGQKTNLFSPDLTSLEVKSIIYDLTKKDDIDRETIKIIGSMHSPCIFLDSYKLNLYKKGLGKWVRSCKDVQIDKTKYPNLNTLLNINK